MRSLRIHGQDWLYHSKIDARLYFKSVVIVTRFATAAPKCELLDYIKRSVHLSHTHFEKSSDSGSATVQTTKQYHGLASSDEQELVDIRVLEETEENKNH